MVKGADMAEQWCYDEAASRGYAINFRERGGRLADEAGRPALTAAIADAADAAAGGFAAPARKFAEVRRLAAHQPDALALAIIAWADEAEAERRELDGDPRRQLAQQRERSRLPNAR